MMRAVRETARGAALAVFLFAGATPLEASAAPPRPAGIDEAFRVAFRQVDTSTPRTLALDELASAAGDGERKRKSPGKAAALSVLVPGLGQIYGGHPYYGAAYLGVEAAGWTGFSIWRTDGFRKRREAREFADAHYDSTVYNRRKDETGDELPNRELPFNDDLEYYEDISKLNELIWGWDDHEPATDRVTGQLVSGSSVNRELYQNQRNDGNGDLRNSRKLGMVLFINHVVSAVHAFKLVQWYNKSTNPSFSGIKLKFKQTRDKEGLMCIASKRF